MNTHTVGVAKRKTIESSAGNCRSCGGPLTHSFLDLGMSPLCESFLKATARQHGAIFPAARLRLRHCFLVQLKEYVSPASIFSEYAYFSSYSTSWVAHARTYCG